MDNLCVLGICGPYGTGKTIALLKMIIQSINVKFFYINLATINSVYITVIKEILRYEIIKVLELIFFLF